MSELKIRIVNFIYDSLINFYGKINFLFKHYPLVVRIRMTNRCNLSCSYCYVEDSLNKKIDNLLTETEWEKVISNLPSYTIIDITGGEPFLTPNFKNIMNIILSKNKFTSIITNGTVEKIDVLEMFVEKSLKYFMVSLDGTREIHDQVRGDGSFLKAMNTLETIQKYKLVKNKKFPIVVAKITYTELNYLEVQSLIEFLFEKKLVDSVTINLLFKNAARNGIVNTEDFEDLKFNQGNLIQFRKNTTAQLANQFLKIRKKYKGLIQVRPDISNKKIEKYFENPSSFYPINCNKFDSVITIYPNGVITPCDIGLHVGNIKELNYNLKFIYRDRCFQKFRNKFVIKKFRKECQGCCLKQHQEIKC